jgi:hypothetical protein
MIRLVRGDLEVEGDHSSVRIGRADDAAEEVIRVDSAELQWLVVAALPAMLAAPLVREPLHPGGKAATVPDGQAHNHQEAQQ